jgi:hypothetical protein
MHSDSGFNCKYNKTFCLTISVIDLPSQISGLDGINFADTMYLVTYFLLLIFIWTLFSLPFLYMLMGFIIFHIQYNVLWHVYTWLLSVTVLKHYCYSNVYEWLHISEWLLFQNYLSVLFETGLSQSFFLCWDEVSLSSPDWSGTHYVSQATTELIIFLPQPSQCWDYRCVPQWLTRQNSCLLEHAI